MMLFLLLEVWAYPVDLTKTIELRVEDPRARHHPCSAMFTGGPDWLEYLIDLTYLTYIRTWVMVRPLQNARWRPLSVQQRRLAMPNFCLNLLFPLSHLNTCPIWYTPDDPVAFWDPRVACVSNNPTILWSACTLFFPCCHFNQQVMSVKLSFKEHQKLWFIQRVETHPWYYRKTDVERSKKPSMKPKVLNWCGFLGSAS